MPWDGDGRSAKEAGDHGTGDAATVASVCVIDVQRSGARSTMGYKVGYPSKHSADWAGMELTICDMCELFTLDTVLLGSKGEGNKRGRGKQERTAGVDVSVMPVSNFELDVLQAKLMFGVTGCVGIFSWSKEEIESHPDTVNGGLVTGGTGGESRSPHKDGHRDWLNASQGRVFLLPHGVNACEAEVLFASLV